MEQYLLWIGILIFSLGLILVIVGRSWVIVRFIFGDRSMIWQYTIGFILVLIGVFILYMSGAFS
ncbi:hypothetical protein IRY55_07915 [Savagea sp. SN6]|uniref:Uncharacterized protein n=1 Tax=Savagea serpentis TaxID=2785297 RepID=A0A8J7GAM8_9BACL|nr:hypothetical protein [Savagea serpentis]MBF4501284.1 hypothetical protein [Savagea serpentis]